MRKQFILFSYILLLLPPLYTHGQDTTGYIFTIENEIPTTFVKDQGRSGTCWSFSTTSFLETEILRLTNKNYDLSEMYFVYRTYLDKAIQYVRFHGNIHFDQGGQAHDVLNVIRRYGMIPEKDYPGKKDTVESHNHRALEKEIRQLIDIIASSEYEISDDWILGVDSILKRYMGELPKLCNTLRANLIPMDFFKSTGLKLDNYIELTSFTHHPYYEQFILEVPDNWALEKYYNLPLHELMGVMDFALDNGYTLVWDGDVSEKNYSTLLGIAVLPEVEWELMDPIQTKDLLSSPHKEVNVTPELRQQAFDEQKSTDDHLMHITGNAKDQNSIKYYITKNSWGPECGPYKGYIYMSEAYVKMKTIAIMVNKEAIPENIASKLDLTSSFSH